MTDYQKTTEERKRAAERRMLWCNVVTIHMGPPHCLFPRDAAIKANSVLDEFDEKFPNGS